MVFRNLVNAKSFSYLPEQHLILDYAILSKSWCCVDLLVNCKTFLHVFPWLPKRWFLSTLFCVCFRPESQLPSAGIQPWDVFQPSHKPVPWLRRWLRASLLFFFSFPEYTGKSGSVCHFVIRQDTETWISFIYVTWKMKVGKKKQKANDFG